MNKDYDIRPELLDEILNNALTSHRYFTKELVNVSSNAYGRTYTVEITVAPDWAPMLDPIPMFSYLKKDKDGNYKI